MYALVFALALALAGCSKDTPTSPAPKVNPGSDGVTSPPGLFPDPGEHPVQGLNTVGGPDKYDIASEVLWGSILGTEKKDVALVRALDGITVLLSGVIEIDGKEQLYLGIDRADFAKHDIDNLRAVLETRFPDIPIYIEESEGVISCRRGTNPQRTQLLTSSLRTSVTSARGTLTTHGTRERSPTKYLTKTRVTRLRWSGQQTVPAPVRSPRNRLTSRGMIPPPSRSTDGWMTRLKAAIS